jgi:peroxiredoxin
VKSSEVDENKFRKQFNLVMGSGHVVAMYPSLDINICAYKVGRHFVESGVKVDKMDVEACIKMVKAGASKEDIKSAVLDKIMPMRKYKKGRAPTIHTKEIIQRLNQKVEMLEKGEVIKTKWSTINENINDVQKSELMGKVLEICIHEIMGNQMYIFDGQAYLQTEGGAIGLRLTGLVARVTMDRVYLAHF